MRNSAFFFFYLWFYFFSRIGLLADNYDTAMVLETTGFLCNLLAVCTYYSVALKGSLKTFHGATLFMTLVPFTVYLVFDIREATRIASFMLCLSVIFIESKILKAWIGRKDLKVSMIWLFYIVHHVVGTIIYLICQSISYMSHSYIELSSVWGQEVSKSAASRFSNQIFDVQNLFGPLMMFSTVIVLGIIIDGNLRKIINFVKGKTYQLEQFVGDSNER